MILVIGAGVVGCAIARELAMGGADVGVIDARRPGLGASRASAGVLAPYIEGHHFETLRALGRQSLDLYDPFIIEVSRDSGRDVIYDRNGTIELAFTDEEAARLEASARTLGAAGVDARWVTGSGVGSIEPGASPRAIGALLVPMHGWVGVTSLTEALAEAARRKGARFDEHTGAIRVSPIAGGGIEVEAGGRRWTADRVVMAAGSWSSTIAVDGADAVPVRPVRGQLLQLQTRPGTVTRVVWGSAGYLVPWPDGTVLVGATAEDVGFDERTTEEGVAGLRAAAAQLIPALADAPLVDARAGLRPRGIDDLPIVGESAVVPGLIYATAHFRNGVLLAPYTAGLVAQIVFGRPLDPGAAWLAPSRAGRL